MTDRLTATYIGTTLVLENNGIQLYYFDVVCHTGCDSPFPQGYETDFQEARGVAERIAGLISKGTFKAQDIAVVYRTKMQV